MAQFLYSTDGSKKITTRAKYLSAPKNRTDFFQRMVWLIGLGYENVENNCWFYKKTRNPVFLIDGILLMVAQNPMIKELNKIFQMHLNSLPKL